MKAYKIFLCELCGEFITQICSLKRHQKRNSCTKKTLTKKPKKSLEFLKNELKCHLIFKESKDFELKPVINTSELNELAFLDDLFPELQSINETHFLFNNSQVLNSVTLSSSFDNFSLPDDVIWTL